MLTAPIVVRKINNHLFDVFFGEQGWESGWARVTVSPDTKNKRMFVKQVSGDVIPAQTFKGIIQKFNKAKE